MRLGQEALSGLKLAFGTKTRAWAVAAPADDVPLARLPKATARSAGHVLLHESGACLRLTPANDDDLPCGASTQTPTGREATSFLDALRALVRPHPLSGPPQVVRFPSTS